MAYDLGGVRPQRARHKLDGARMSARNLPVEPSWSCRRRAPRHGCQPCLRGSRPSSRVPSALSLSASRFRDTHSTRTVQPTGTCRAPATVAARVVWVRVADGTTTALHPGPGKEGPARVPHKEQQVSPPPPAPCFGFTTRLVLAMVRLTRCDRRAKIRNIDCQEGALGREDTTHGLPTHARLAGGCQK